MIRRGLAATAALAVLALVAAVIALWRTVPPLGGEATLPGLTAAVDAAFDRHGIPHIRAANDLDAFRALGYVHARDRFFAMDVLRRAAAGRLAELFGPDAVLADRYLRSLDLTRAVRGSQALTDSASRAVVRAYADGVNAWVASGRRPLEYLLLRARPEPWSAEDTWAIGRLQAWDLANDDLELGLARALARVGPDRVAELFPAVPETAAVILPPGSHATWAARGAPPAGGRTRERTALPPRLRARDVPVVPPLAAAILAGSVMRRASNSWVVAGARTRSGRPLLANDPHLNLRAPSLWYVAALESPGYTAVGATIPGLPIVVIGRNRRIAWGLTNVMADDADYVVERLSADSSQVLTSDGWRPVNQERSVIRVRGADTVAFVLRRTSHGPIVAGAPPGVSARPEAAPPDSAGPRVLALRWNGHEPGDELGAFLAVARAASWAEFLAGVARLRAPEQNWVYADVDGNIGYTTSGAIPVRHAGNGLLPAAGWTDAGRWERYLDFDELPRALNPPQGFIVTANNRVIGAEYPHHLASGWAQPWRAARIRQRLQAAAALTPADLLAIQMDTLDLFAAWARSLAAGAAARAGRDDLERAWRAWDGTMGGDRHEAAVFAVWYKALLRLTFEDELGGVYAPESPFQAWLFAGDSPWFDDTRTVAREDLVILSDRALHEALAVVGARRWGELHRRGSLHPLGRVALLDRLFRLNVGPRPSGGSRYTVNVSEVYGLTAPFLADEAPSLRFIADLSDAKTAAFVLPTGQSGHPLSRRYRDQERVWWRGALLEVSVASDPSRVHAVLRLRPARADSPVVP